MLINPRFYATARAIEPAYVNCTWNVSKTVDKGATIYRVRFEVEQPDGKRQSLTAIISRDEAKAFAAAFESVVK